MKKQYNITEGCTQQQPSLSNSLLSATCSKKNLVHNRVLISENHTGIRNLYLAKVRVTGQVVRSCQTSHTDGYGAFQGCDVLNGTVQVGFGDPQVLELY